MKVLKNVPKDVDVYEEKEGRVFSMKGLFRKIKLFAIVAAFLGASGAGMAALMESPVLAAENSEIRIADAKSGYSLPSTITVKKGETKTVTLTTPSGNAEVCNVNWSYSPNYVSFSSVGGYGSYWGQPARCTITGKNVGTYTMNVAVKIFKKKGDPSSYVKTLNLTAKVNVVDGNTKTVTAQAKRPLQKISLSKTSAALTAGSSLNLTVGYTPTNTTDSKTVKWSTSNSAVATVSGGKVVAKKAGTAVITAKVGTKSATCKVTVSAKKAAAPKESYKNVSEAYTLTNSFRTTKSNQWYWNANNKTKTYVYGLKALTRDTALENIAKQRAKEQWTQKYVNGKTGHTRPNGKAWTTAYPASVKVLGENLSFGRTTCRDVILNGWAETDKKYDNQGHRRNMLHKQAKRVGIACYEKDGKTCWAMALGY